MSSDPDLELWLPHVLQQAAAARALIAAGQLELAAEPLAVVLPAANGLCYHPQISNQQKQELEECRLQMLQMSASGEMAAGVQANANGHHLAAVKCAMRAAKRFRQTEEYSGRARALQNAANAYLRLDRFERAQPVYRQCLDLFELLGEDDKCSEIREALRQLESEPFLGFLNVARDRDLLCIYAEQLLAAGRVEEALEHLDHALAQAPDFAGAWDMRGQCLARLGGDQDALVCQRKSVECDPTDAVAYRNLAHRLFAMGQYAEAIERASDSLDLNPEHSEVLLMFAQYMMHALNIGLVPYRKELLFDPLAALDEAIEIDPDCGAAYANKAGVLLALGYLPAAREAVTQAAALGVNPDLLAPVLGALDDTG